MDTLQWDKRSDYYKKLDRKAFYEIWQDTTKEYLADYQESIDNDYFYSIQDNKRGLTEITILSQREGAYCDWIDYLIFNISGKPISSFRVAGSCSDGGYDYNASGHFLNDSVYVLFSEDNYETTGIVYEGTQTITYRQETTTITRSGKIRQDDKILRRETK
jgi:hypothetical protein